MLHIPSIILSFNRKAKKTAANPGEHKITFELTGEAFFDPLISYRGDDMIRIPDGVIVDEQQAAPVPGFSGCLAMVKHISVRDCVLTVFVKLKTGRLGKPVCES